MYDLALVLVGTLGLVVGLGLGLSYAMVITWQLQKLGGRMGTQVLQAARLSAHVASQYAPLLERLGQVERDVARIRKRWIEGG